MSVLSVNLAYKNYRDIGVVALQMSPSRKILCENISLELKGTPEPPQVAHQLAELAIKHGCKIIMLDGP